MTFLLLLCVLGALTAGLFFGRGFADAHRQGRSPALPVLGHAAVSAVLVMLSVLFDTSELGLLWMMVATASLAGLALGALFLDTVLPRPLVAAVPSRNEGHGRSVQSV